MGDSYRIKTELGINKSINIQLDQEFEFLEILSLKIQQTDIYTRSCADYGVLVGRITANNGFGLPNARVSIFIPIEQVDQSNPLITSIYPYKSPTDKNEDGFRYNLLPYVKSYSKHASTGTFPSRADVLTGDTAVEIYDKYYRFTSKTNESGDYMIMGVPLGDQTVVMDVDLSDIGEFSLTPQDLIRIGLATEAQVAGNKFRTSNDLNSLPQIINLSKNAEISPLWGDPEICQISINRLDFDLRDDANVDIQPTSVFMGSMFSSPDGMRVRKNCSPRDNMGNLCGLIATPGQILSIRQTIQQDEDGNPVLEVFELEQAGNVIDGTGAWLTELPMNLDYFITNEFGEKVLSNDPTVGIPTKAKYRFKVKWSQPNELTLQTRRAYYLVPNVKEYGWQESDVDPTYSTNQNTLKQQQSSYYFGLAWSGYTNGFTGTKKTDRLNEIIDCEDTFYEFQYNRVYTVSSLIDQYKKGAKGRFIGIKEIDDDECESTVNKFPVNDGFRNFDLLFFVFSILMVIIQPIGLIVLTLAHILLWLNNLFRSFLCAISKIKIAGWRPFKRWRKYCGRRDNTIRLPMITYPDCQACDCKQDTQETQDRQENGGVEGVLSPVSSPEYYDTLLNTIVFSADTETGQDKSILYSEGMAGFSLLNFKPDSKRYKLPLSQAKGFSFVASYDLPIGERINIFNQRSSYFANQNKIKVTFAKDLNVGKHHYDNTITVLSTEQYEAGELLTFVNVTGSTDPNFLYSGVSSNGTILRGISGETYNGTGATQVSIAYAVSQTENISTPVVYNLPYGSGNTNYKFPADIEYYQVVTALTVSQASQIWNTGATQSFGNIINSPTRLRGYIRQLGAWVFTNTLTLNPFEYFEEAQSQYILVLQRGVDPYSPKYRNEYSLGTLFGSNDSDPNWTFTAETRVNIPIQKINVSNMSVQPYSQDGMYYPSYFFKPGTTPNLTPGQSFTGFTTTATAYYGSLDATTNPLPIGSSTTGTNASNPGTLGNARRITYFTSSLTTSNGVCNITGPSDSLFVPNVPQTSIPLVGIKLYQNYDPNWGIGYSSPLNGQNKWFKMNWNGSFYSVQVSPTGYVLSFNSCTTSSSLPTVVSRTDNGFYSGIPATQKYDASEDLSGMGVMSSIVNDIFPYTDDYNYYLKFNYGTSTFFSLSNSAITISNSVNNVLRTDRLPSSDGLDGGSFATNPALLQQNLNFNIYNINAEDVTISSQGGDTGADIVTVDIEGLPNAITVLSSFDCENMVGLECYQGFGSQFEINQNCTTADAVEKGCYMFMRVPLTDLPKDYRNFGQWAYRFRFFYGLCRGVLSQSFMNNWINGTLYSFPIQVDTYYNSKNKVSKQSFCRDVVYFNADSNNFYYRSSPYNDSSNKFIGMETNNAGTVNNVNLLYPTTILNLGMKDSFYSEITFDPSTNGYVLPNINPTSYGDTSDLVNLFVISRITDETFLKQILAIGDNSLNQLFSRDGSQRRIDGDLAQMMSINCEIGNINFSPEYYDIIPGQTNQPTTILGSPSNPAIAVWFSSTTQDLQTKDYLTPGRINFRGSNNVGYYPYPYGIKSQVVPFYQWQLNNTSTIFGNQYNTWATAKSDLVQNTRYQSMDRFNTSTPYFLGSNSMSNDLNARGYIFNVNGTVGNGQYSTTGAINKKFVVGAPFQFYFGTIKGETALDKFKTKYSLDE